MALQNTGLWKIPTLVLNKIIVIPYQCRDYLIELLAPFILCLNLAVYFIFKLKIFNSIMCAQVSNMKYTNIFALCSELSECLWLWINRHCIINIGIKVLQNFLNAKSACCSNNQIQILKEYIVWRARYNLKDQSY